MPHADLEAALQSVPFLAPIGVGVAEASSGRIVLKIPADKRTRDYEGNIASGALFVVGELAATLALSSHPEMAQRAVRRTHSSIEYAEATNRPLLAVAEVGLLPDLVGDEPEVRVVTRLMDRDEVVATVCAGFTVPRR